MKSKVLKYIGIGIAGLIVLSVGSFLVTSDDIMGDLEAAEAEDNAKAEARAEKAEADKEKKAKAKADAKAEIDKQLADFEETESYLIANSAGAITAVDIEHTGVHYKVNVFVDEQTWAASSESEKESFATSIGDTVQGALPDTSLVDFRSAQNNDIVAEGKILGGYDIKR